MFAHLASGLRAALKHPKLVALLWGGYLLLALVPALPGLNWLRGAMDFSPAAGTALQRFDFGLAGELSNYDHSNVFGLLTMTLLGGVLVALLSSAFAMGGTLEVLGGEGEARPFMHRFFRGGGHFFWRFVRLTIIAAVCLVIVVGVVSVGVGAATTPLADSEWEPAGYLAGFARMIVAVLVGALFLLALDYARIRVARDGGRSMFKAYVRALGFVLRRLLTAYGIAIPIVVMLAALMVCYLAYETNAPAASTWGAIATLFLIQQAVVLGRVFLRVSLVGAERQYDLTMRPTPAPAAAFVPAVEGSTSAAEQPPLSADSASPQG
jgi:hypothetical protein